MIVTAIALMAYNVDLTGAARLYRAASSDRRERGCAPGWTKPLRGESGPVDVAGLDSQYDPSPSPEGLFLNEPGGHLKMETSSIGSIKLRGQRNPSTPHNLAQGFYTALNIFFAAGITHQTDAPNFAREIAQTCADFQAISLE